MPPEPYRIGVPDLATARLVLAWAASGGHLVRLYGLDAPRAGVGFWLAVAELLDRPLVVDCAGHVGTALAALRVGLKRLHLGAAAARQQTALAGLAAAHGAVLIAAAPSVRLDGTGTPTPSLARMRLEEVTARLTPVKDRGDTSDICATRDRLGCV